MQDGPGECPPGVTSVGDSLILGASVQDKIGTIKTAVKTRANRMGLETTTPGDLTERLSKEEIPLFISTRSGQPPQFVLRQMGDEIPDDIDQIAYSYRSSQSAGVRVREVVAEESETGGYWRLDTLYDDQLSVGVLGDRPNDFKFQYIGTVYCDLDTGHNEYGCDFCHKVGGVYLNPASGSVYPNAPGAQSQRMLRPPAGDNIFFGPYDDIKDPDTYLPLTTQSQYCAPCQQFSFWGTPIYESYTEWLDSPYAAAGITCQDCHMPPNGDAFFALPEVGGLEHPPDMIPSHLQLGASNTKLLTSTVSMTLSTNQTADRLAVTVAITNTGAGHHVPTDYPGRHMILTVTAEDGGGQALPLLDGPVVPAWGGDEAGLPGIVFAKVLRDAVTGEAPVVTYWKQSLIEIDNRLPAQATSRSAYAFSIRNDGSEVDIKARLIFRRVFQDVAVQKDWNKPDIVMEETDLILHPQPTFKVFSPVMTTNP